VILQKKRWIAFLLACISAVAVSIGDFVVFASSCMLDAETVTDSTKQTASKIQYLFLS